MEKPVKETSIPSNEMSNRPPKWLLDCEKHGRQEAAPETVQQWDDEEMEQVMRAKGTLEKGEHYCTGNCPLCGTTKQVFAIDKKDKGPTSKDMLLS